MKCPYYNQEMENDINGAKNILLMSPLWQKSKTY